MDVNVEVLKDNLLRYHHVKLTWYTERKVTEEETKKITAEAASDPQIAPPSKYVVASIPTRYVLK